MTDPPSWWTPDLAVHAEIWLLGDTGAMGRDAYPAAPATPCVPARRCVRCQASLAGMRADARYCSHACRQAAWRAVKAGRLMTDADLVSWLRSRPR